MQRRTNGRLIRVKLGDYPALPLADARTQARAAIEQMSQGLDPRQTQLKTTASAARDDSFEAAVDSYIRRDVIPNRRPRTRDEIVRPLRKILVPRWGTLPLSTISSSDILKVLDEIADAEKPVAANRTYSVIRRFFRWALERQLVKENPAGMLRKPHRERARERYLSDIELAQVWLIAQQLGWPFGPFIHALILTAQRRSEVSGMLWNEIDLERRLWTIPSARTKNGLEHALPLSAGMILILESAPTHASRIGPVFSTTGDTGVSGFSRAKRKLDQLLTTAAEVSTAEGVHTNPPARWVLHDIRRSVATGMGRIGVFPHVIEAILNHSSGFRAGVAGVYMRHPYLDERKLALSQWSEHMRSLITPPGDNILSFSAGRTSSPQPEMPAA